MKKSAVILLTAVVVLLAVLSYLAVNKYEHRVKGITLQQAVGQRDRALSDLQKTKAIDQYKIISAQNQAADLANQKATICLHIKAKVVEPLCAK